MTDFSYWKVSHKILRSNFWIYQNINFFDIVLLVTWVWSAPLTTKVHFHDNKSEKSTPPHWLVYLIFLQLMTLNAVFTAAIYHNWLLLPVTNKRVIDSRRRVCDNHPIEVPAISRPLPIMSYSNRCQALKWDCLQWKFINLWNGWQNISLQ